MDNKKPSDDVQADNESNEKETTPSPTSPEKQAGYGSHGESASTKHSEQTATLEPPYFNPPEKRGGYGFTLFFSLLISLASLLIAGYLFTDSAGIKSKLKTAQLESDFFNKRSEMFAYDFSQWKNNVIKNMEKFDTRLIQTESFLANDIKERRDIELTKLLMGINELSRFSDDSAKAKIEEAAIILQSITKSETESSLQAPPRLEVKKLLPVEVEEPRKPELFEGAQTNNSENSSEEKTVEEESTEEAEVPSEEEVAAPDAPVNEIPEL